MYRRIAEMYPICRSITGNGLRKTLAILGEAVPVELHEVPTGKKVFDWTIPKEWNVRDAWIRDPRGRKIVDFRNSNLHLVNYSVPVRGKMPLSELKAHLFTLPGHPGWIPYRTSYYQENWGFCIPHEQLASLEEGVYEVHVDTTLEPGSMTYGECFLPGETSEEILVSCHACHPSLCNDNLSGLSLAATLARGLLDVSRRYSYRFLFIPGTIGAIAWLSENETRVDRVKHGLVVACVGDGGKPTYKKSRRGNATIDVAASHVLKHSGSEYEIAEFSPYGYDERQFCSPAFDLPIGSLTRTPHGRYPEYHTSADDMDLVRESHLADSLSLYLDIFDVLENDRTYRNLNPKCEPQLGRRGLYRMMGGEKDSKLQEMAMLWVLNLSDGNHTTLQIAERAGLKFDLVDEAAGRLIEGGLLEICGTP
jgi:aminopeptidase-like protein